MTKVLHKIDGKEIVLNSWEEIKNVHPAPISSGYGSGVVFSNNKSVLVIETKEEIEKLSKRTFSNKESEKRQAKINEFLSMHIESLRNALKMNFRIWVLIGACIIIAGINTYSIMYLLGELQTSTSRFLTYIHVGLIGILLSFVIYTLMKKK